MKSQKQGTPDGGNHRAFRNTSSLVTDQSTTSRQFVKLHYDLLNRSDLNSSAKLVLAVIADRARSKGKAWPGIRRLAADIGCNCKTIMKAIRKLADRDLLIVEKRENGRRNLYRLPELAVPETGAPPKIERSIKGNQGVPLNGTEAVPFLPHKQLEPWKQKKTSARRKTATPDSRVSEFLSWFCEEYLKTKGREYVVSGGKDGATVKRLLQSLDGNEKDGMAKLQRASKNMFADGWCKDKASIGMLSSQINRLLESPTTQGTGNDEHYKNGF